jgi:hypothetical protein
MNKAKIPITHLLADIRIARHRDLIRNLRTFTVDESRSNITTFNTTQLMSVDNVAKLRTYLQTRCEDVEYAEVFPDGVSIRYKV